MSLEKCRFLLLVGLDVWVVVIMQRGLRRVLDWGEGRGCGVFIVNFIVVVWV